MWPKKKKHTADIVSFMICWFSWKHNQIFDNKHYFFCVYKIEDSIFFLSQTVHTSTKSGKHIAIKKTFIFLFLQYNVPWDAMQNDAKNTFSLFQEPLLLVLIVWLFVKKKYK